MRYIVRLDIKSEYLIKSIRYEGLSLIRSYETEFPKRYFQDFLNYIEMNEHDFFNLVDIFRSPHLLKKERVNWKFRN